MLILEFLTTLRSVLESIDEQVEHALDEVMLRGWLDATNGDLVQAERAMNHRHLLDVLGESFPPSSEFNLNELLLFAEFYKTHLNHRLIETYPNQVFKVEVIGVELVESDPMELTVTFYRTN